MESAYLNFVQSAILQPVIFTGGEAILSGCGSLNKFHQAANKTGESGGLFAEVKVSSSISLGYFISKRVDIMSSLLMLGTHRSYRLYHKGTEIRNAFNGFAESSLVSWGARSRKAMPSSSSIAPALWSMGREALRSFYQRLEKGAFEMPAFDLDAKSQILTSNQAHFIFQGVSLHEVRYCKRY